MFVSYRAEKQEMSANICFVNKEILTTRQKKKKLTDLFFEFRGHQMPPKNRAHNI